MEKLDLKASQELQDLLKSRGIDYSTARKIAFLVKGGAHRMVLWLKDNPDASSADITWKALELNRLQ